MPRKTTKAATAPLKRCPFTGKELTVVQVSGGLWQLRGPGWTCTKLFPSDRHAWHWASFRDGVAPAFSPIPGSVEAEVSDIPEPDPAEDIIPEVLRKA